MFNKDGKLDIFEQFHNNTNLPKFAKGTQPGDGGFAVAMIGNFGSITLQRPAGGLWKRLLGLSFKRPSTISIREFFSHTKNSLDQLQVVGDMADKYASAIRQARESHQKALEEKLLLSMGVNRSEAQLCSIGQNKFMTEDHLVRFVKMAPRGLRLDWIANFTRIIPDEVLAKKSQCDELEIFDNYVVLHYDPDKKSWAETQEEEYARKDPILFGVISGSRRLYYVGDWVDEFCDLTLDQVVAIAGAPAVHLLRPE